MIDAGNKIKGTRGGALCIRSLDPWKSQRAISDLEKRNHQNMHDRLSFVYILKRIE